MLYRLDASLVAKSTVSKQWKIILQNLRAIKDKQEAQLILRNSQLYANHHNNYIIIIIIINVKINMK